MPKVEQGCTNRQPANKPSLGKGFRSGDWVLHATKGLGEVTGVPRIAGAEGVAVLVRFEGQSASGTIPCAELQPAEAPRAKERDHWQQLILLGQLPAGSGYSPSKAKEGYYGKALKEALRRPAQQAPAADSVADALGQLASKADELIEGEIPHSQRIIHLREAAKEIEVSVRDAELIRLLADARRRKDGSAVSVGSRQLDPTPIPWMVEGLLRAGCLNLLVAPPKVGKTSFALNMIRHWADGAATYLGQRFLMPCPPVLLVGPDMPEPDWAVMLQHEGLLADLRLRAPLVDLFTAASTIKLDEEGIDMIATYAAAHPGLLVVCDSLKALASGLGISENDQEIDEPIRALVAALEPHGATILLIHHAGKGRIGEGPEIASRGSSSIPAAASLLVGLNKMTRQPGKPADPRVVLKTTGRCGMPLELLIQRTDAGWISHGDAAQVEAAAAIAEIEDRLSDRQAEALEAVRDRWDLDGLTTDSMELAARLGLKGDAERKARSTLDQLARKGLLEVEMQNTGASRRKVFRPIPSGGVSSEPSDPSDPSEPSGIGEGPKSQNPEGERDRRDRRDRRLWETLRDGTLRTDPTLRTGSGADVVEGDDPHWGPRAA
jgi:hypothetical protein